MQAGADGCRIVQPSETSCNEQPTDWLGALRQSGPLEGNGAPCRMLPRRPDFEGIQCAERGVAGRDPHSDPKSPVRQEPPGSRLPVSAGTHRLGSCVMQGAETQPAPELS